MSASVVSVTTGRRIGRGQGATANAEGLRSGSRIRGCRRNCAGHALAAIREGVIAAKQGADLARSTTCVSLPKAAIRNREEPVVPGTVEHATWSQGTKPSRPDRPIWRRISSKLFALSDQNLQVTSITGPDDWIGRRFDHPHRGRAGGSREGSSPEWAETACRLGEADMAE
jgi:hypothetical protein